MKGQQVLGWRRFNRLGGPFKIVRIDDDACSAMVERLHHLTLVKWNPFTRPRSEAVTATDQFPFALFQSDLGAKR